MRSTIRQRRIGPATGKAAAVTVTPMRLAAAQCALHRRIVGMLESSVAGLDLPSCDDCFAAHGDSPDCHAALRCLRRRITQRINGELNAAMGNATASADPRSLLALRALFQALVEISRFEESLPEEGAKAAAKAS